MIKKIRSIIIFIFFALYLFLFNSSSFAQTTPSDDICTQVQCVKMQNGYLWVLSSDNVTYEPYFVKAVGYEPTPVGRYPSDWGYAPTDPRSSNNNIYDDPEILNRDFSKLRQMNANTVRIWKGNKTTVSCQCTNNGRFPDYMTNAGNTINVDTTQNTLDLADRYGLKVIAGFWVNFLTFDASNNIGSTDDNGNALSRQDIINNFVAYVNTFKGNRAILFWAIGNENNYQLLGQSAVSMATFENTFGATAGTAIFNWLQQNSYVDFDGDVIVDLTSPAILSAMQAEFTNTTEYNQILGILNTARGENLSAAQLAAWYSLVNSMAQAAHQAEGATFHPVTVVNGGIAEIGNNTDGATDSQLSYVDIWGANVYTGQSFGTLFSSYAAKSSKPLWISEYGIDSWSVTNTSGINNWGLTLASDLGGTGSYDPATQSAWDVDLWGEISNNSPVTIGGSLMEYSDEWWKPYEFYCTSPNTSQNNNSISSGICNSNHKYFGFPSAAFPDNFSNEEWWGIMSISPNSSVGGPDVISPRTVYNGLQAQWQANPWPSLTLNITGSGRGVISSSSTLGAALNCNFSSGSGTGLCSTAFSKNQPITLSFSSNNSSTVTNWGIAGCASGSTTCNTIPNGNIILNVTIASLPVAPTVIFDTNSYTYQAPASVYLSAFASESGGTISKVAFYNGATLLNTSTVAIADGPYSKFVYVWNNSTPGIYSLTAKVYDANNNVTTSAPVTVTIHGLPTVSLTAKSSSATAPATITLTANAVESFGTIRQVEFFNGKTLLGKSATSPYTFIWNNVGAGNYNLTAMAFDNSNNAVRSAPITVVVRSRNVLQDIIEQRQLLRQFQSLLTRILPRKTKMF